MLEKLKDYTALVSNKFERKPQILHTDNGVEYMANIVPNSIKMYSKLVKYVVTAARNLYASRCKKESLPDILDWSNKLMEYGSMVKLTCLMHNKLLSEFNRKWSLIVDYIA